MMRYFLFILLILGILAGLVFLILQGSGVTSISFNEWSAEVKTPLFLLALMAAFLLFYMALRILIYIFSIRSRLSRMNRKRLRNKANKELVQGFTAVCRRALAKGRETLA